MATNALLERKGHKHTLLIRRGFKDLLIRNQSRPKIFDLNIRRPPPLYSTVVEVDGRVTLVGYTSDPKAEEHAVQFDGDGKVTRGYRGKGWDGKGDAEGPGDIVRGLSGEAVRIMKRPGAFFAAKTCALTNILIPTFMQILIKSRLTYKSYTTRTIDPSPSCLFTRTHFRTTSRPLVPSHDH